MPAISPCTTGAWTASGRSTWTVTLSPSCRGGRPPSPGPPPPPCAGGFPPGEPAPVPPCLGQDGAGIDGKAVVQQGFVVSPVVAVVEGDADQGLAIPLRAGDQGAAGLAGVSRLHPGAPLVLPQEFVVVDQLPVLQGEAFWWPPPPPPWGFCRQARPSLAMSRAEA